MALSIIAFAALITANIWYCTNSDNLMGVGILYLIYTAAALIMFVVNEIKYLTGSLVYITADFADLFKETCLGFFVVVLGFIIWLVVIYTKYTNKYKYRKGKCFTGSESSTEFMTWVNSIK